MENKTKKRSSILKRPSNDDDNSPTQTITKSLRRISFSGKKSIKEFFPGEDKATIWGTSYEESASGEYTGLANSTTTTDVRQDSRKDNLTRSKNTDLSSMLTTKSNLNEIVFNSEISVLNKKNEITNVSHKKLDSDIPINYTGVVANETNTVFSINNSKNRSNTDDDTKQGLISDSNNFSSNNITGNFTINETVDISLNTYDYQKLKITKNCQQVISSLHQNKTRNYPNFIMKDQSKLNCSSLNISFEATEEEKMLLRNRHRNKENIMRDFSAESDSTTNLFRSDGNKEIITLDKHEKLKRKSKDCSPKCDKVISKFSKIPLRCEQNKSVCAKSVTEKNFTIYEDSNSDLTRKCSSGLETITKIDSKEKIIVASSTGTEKAEKLITNSSRLYLKENMTNEHSDVVISSNSECIISKFDFKRTEDMQSCTDENIFKNNATISNKSAKENQLIVHNKVLTNSTTENIMKSGNSTNKGEKIGQNSMAICHDINDIHIEIAKEIIEKKEPPESPKHRTIYEKNISDADIDAEKLSLKDNDPKSLQRRGTIYQNDSISDIENNYSIVGKFSECPTKCGTIYVQNIGEDNLEKENQPISRHKTVYEYCEIDEFENLEDANKKKIVNRPTIYDEDIDIDDEDVEIDKNKKIKENLMKSSYRQGNITNECEIESVCNKSINLQNRNDENRGTIYNQKIDDENIESECREHSLGEPIKILNNNQEKNEEAADVHFKTCQPFNGGSENPSKNKNRGTIYSEEIPKDDVEKELSEESFLESLLRRGKLKNVNRENMSKKKKIRGTIYDQEIADEDCKEQGKFLSLKSEVDKKNNNRGTIYDVEIAEEDIEDKSFRGENISESLQNPEIIVNSQIIHKLTGSEKNRNRATIYEEDIAKEDMDGYVIKENLLKSLKSRETVSKNNETENSKYESSNTLKHKNRPTPYNKDIPKKENEIGPNASSEESFLKSVLRRGTILSNDEMESIGGSDKIVLTTSTQKNIMDEPFYGLKNDKRDIEDVPKEKANRGTIYAQEIDEENIEIGQMSFSKTPSLLKRGTIVHSYGTANIGSSVKNLPNNSNKKNVNRGTIYEEDINEENIETDERTFSKTSSLQGRGTVANIYEVEHMGISTQNTLNNNNKEKSNRGTIYAQEIDEENIEIGQMSFSKTPSLLQRGTIVHSYSSANIGSSVKNLPNNSNKKNVNRGTIYEEDINEENIETDERKFSKTSSLQGRGTVANIYEVEHMGISTQNTLNNNNKEKSNRGTIYAQEIDEENIEIGQMSFSKTPSLLQRGTIVHSYSSANIGSSVKNLPNNSNKKNVNRGTIYEEDINEENIETDERKFSKTSSLQGRGTVANIYEVEHMGISTQNTLNNNNKEKSNRGTIYAQEIDEENIEIGQMSFSKTPSLLQRGTIVQSYSTANIGSGVNNLPNNSNKKNVNRGTIYREDINEENIETDERTFSKTSSLQGRGTVANIYEVEHIGSSTQNTPNNNNKEKPNRGTIYAQEIDEENIEIGQMSFSKTPSLVKRGTIVHSYGTANIGSSVKNLPNNSNKKNVNRGTIYTEGIDEENIETDQSRLRKGETVVDSYGTTSIRSSFQNLITSNQKNTKRETIYGEKIHEDDMESKIRNLETESFSNKLLNASKMKNLINKNRGTIYCQEIFNDDIEFDDVNKISNKNTLEKSKYSEEERRKASKIVNRGTIYEQPISSDDMEFDIENSPKNENFIMPAQRRGTTFNYEEISLTDVVPSVRIDKQKRETNQKFQCNQQEDAYNRDTRAENQLYTIEPIRDCPQPSECNMTLGDIFDPRKTILKDLETNVNQLHKPNLNVTFPDATLSKSIIDKNLNNFKSIMLSNNEAPLLQKSATRNDLTCNEIENSPTVEMNSVPVIQFASFTADIQNTLNIQRLEDTVNVKIIPEEKENMENSLKNPNINACVEKSLDNQGTFDKRNSCELYSRKLFPELVNRTETMTDIKSKAEALINSRKENSSINIDISGLEYMSESIFPRSKKMPISSNTHSEIHKTQNGQMLVNKSVDRKAITANVVETDMEEDNSNTMDLELFCDEKIKAKLLTKEFSLEPAIATQTQTRNINNKNYTEKSIISHRSRIYAPIFSSTITNNKATSNRVDQTLPLTSEISPNMLEEHETINYVLREENLEIPIKSTKRQTIHFNTDIDSETTLVGKNILANYKNAACSRNSIENDRNINAALEKIDNGPDKSEKNSIYFTQNKNERVENSVYGKESEISMNTNCKNIPIKSTNQSQKSRQTILFKNNPNLEISFMGNQEEFCKQNDGPVKLLNDNQTETDLCSEVESVRRNLALDLNTSNFGELFCHKKSLRKTMFPKEHTPSEYSTERKSIIFDDKSSHNHMDICEAEEKLLETTQSKSKIYTEKITDQSTYGDCLTTESVSPTNMTISSNFKRKTRNSIYLYKINNSEHGNTTTFSPNSTEVLCNLDPSRIMGSGKNRSKQLTLQSGGEYQVEKNSSTESPITVDSTINTDYRKKFYELTCESVIFSSPSSDIEKTHLSLVDSKLSNDTQEKSSHQKFLNRSPSPSCVLIIDSKDNTLNTDEEQCTDDSFTPAACQNPLSDFEKANIHCPNIEESNKTPTVNIQFLPPNNVNKSSLSTHKMKSNSRTTCKKCRKCDATLNETSILDDSICLLPSNKSYELDFSGYKKFENHITLNEIISDFKKKLSSNNIENSLEETKFFPRTPPIDFLLENYLQTLTISDATPDEDEEYTIMPILPIIPPFEYLLENKIKSECTKWNYCDIFLPMGLLEFRHKQVKTVRMIMKFNQETLKIGKFYIDEVYLKKCSIFQNLSAQDALIEDEILSKMGYNLKHCSESSDDVMPFLNFANCLCESAVEKVKKLMQILIEYESFLDKDEENIVFIRKVIRNMDDPWSKPIEMYMKILKIDDLSYQNIVFPAKSKFNDIIKDLPKGLDFLKCILRQPHIYLK